MELREDIEKQLNAALLASVSASVDLLKREQAERQGPLAELNQKISQVESEVTAHANMLWS